MTAWRQAIELSIADEDLAKLVSITRSRTEPASRVERALAYGPMAALDDRPRLGKEPTITVEAKAWVADLACRKAKELGYPHELWTTRLLARHAREHGPAQGHICLARLAQGTLCNILNEQEIKPHKVPLLPGTPRPGVQ